MIELKRCKKCLLPETHETIIFDEQGVCNVCRQNEFKKGKIDWTQKKREEERRIHLLTKETELERSDSENPG